nr:hypothetical protein [Tanacetum cinerariifolium]
MNPNPTAQKVRINILQYLIHLRMCKDVPTKMMKMFLLVENLRQQNPDNRKDLGISIQGYCDEADEKIIVYEYASRGSLDKYLSDDSLTPEMVIHRNINSGNILLFDDWKAKISDFGLSLVCTIGYCDPPSLKTCFLTKESDIFSLCAVLFDILCGKVSSVKLDDEYLYLPFLAKQHYQEDYENWEPKLPKDYKEIIQMSKCLEIYSTIKKEDLYNILSTGVFLQQDKVLLSFDGNRERNKMVIMQMLKLVKDWSVRDMKAMGDVAFDDIWCGQQPLKEVFPRIYSLDTDKGCFIANRVGLHDWNLVLRRTPRGGTESAQFNSLKDTIGNIILTGQHDSWQWSLDMSKGFSVASVRQLVDSHILVTGNEATRWNRSLPIKVNMFLWRLKLNKLPSRVNLDRRGIEISSLLCPLCLGDFETVNHSFFNCDMAKGLWSLFASGGRWIFWFVAILRSVIMEYLVNISKRHAFWSLNEDLLKINDSNNQYAVSIKKDTTYLCPQSPKTTKERRPIRHIQERQYAVFKLYGNKIFWKISNVVPTQETPIRRILSLGYADEVSPKSKNDMPLRDK